MGKMKSARVKISLAVYDIAIFVVLLLLLYKYSQMKFHIEGKVMLVHTALMFVTVCGCRLLMKIYRQVWRYGGIECFIKLLVADASAFVIYEVINLVVPRNYHLLSGDAISFFCLNTLFALSMRMLYRFAYKCGSRDDIVGKILRLALKVGALGRVTTEADPDSQKIRVAIIGAGSVGVNLLEELKNNPKSKYIVRCFVDSDAEKVGRDIHDVGVEAENADTIAMLKRHHTQEVILAVPSMDMDKKMKLYDYYKNAGFSVKVYDYPSVNVPNAKRTLRDFNIEDFLMRKQEEFLNDKTCAYYENKVVLITGGGGSIGSELCRQLAKMGPKQLIILDVYENGAYELQQSLKFKYGDVLDVRVEVVSITNKKGLARVFEKYHPEIVINAAAHKHVPLMETNCIEAVENNVFGTLNVIQLCEEYGADRFMMVSTDKAVNPTNIMGATKRMCERIMQAYSTRGIVKCSATRFGNVLGSAGSVIPLFQKQIEAGGPVTVTDRRIIRYFMTIPEASQLVLTSGAMASNGELFVLDMGKPVSIWELAEKMVEMSGRLDVEIQEVGLRPGEKLYEELLVESEDIQKTENDLIFIEQDKPITMEQLEKKLAILEAACETNESEKAREALHQVVSSFKKPEEVNKKV